MTKNFVPKLLCHYEGTDVFVDQSFLATPCNLSLTSHIEREA